MKAKLTIPDMIIFDDHRRILVIFEVCKVFCSLALCFNPLTPLVLPHSQIKMNSSERWRAKEQIENSIFGNWQADTAAMGGVLCLGGVVNNSKHVFCISLEFMPLTTCRCPSSHMNENRRGSCMEERNETLYW